MCVHITCESTNIHPGIRWRDTKTLPINTPQQYLRPSKKKHRLCIYFLPIHRTPHIPIISRNHPQAILSSTSLSRRLSHFPSHEPPTPSLEFDPRHEPPTGLHPIPQCVEVVPQYPHRLQQAEPQFGPKPQFPPTVEFEHVPPFKLHPAPQNTSPFPQYPH